MSTPNPNTYGVSSRVTTSTSAQFSIPSVDLRTYPTIISQNSANTVTLGDMHGNTVKFIWCLIREGIITIEPRDYDEMVRLYMVLYHEPIYEKKFKAYIYTASKQQELNSFLGLISKIHVAHGKKLRLLGDLFGDRGANDFLTLKVIEKLHVSGEVILEIIYSNHDAWLLANYTKDVVVSHALSVCSMMDDGKTFLTDSLDSVLAKSTPEWDFFNVKRVRNSMVSLYVYIRSGAIRLNEVQRLINSYIKPYIKLISYSLSTENTIDLYMHAPNHFEVIPELLFRASQQQRIDKTISLQGLIEKIGLINSHFSLLLRKDPQLNIELKFISAQVCKANQSEQKAWEDILYPFFKCIFNRLDGMLGNKPFKMFPGLSIGQINFNTYPSYVSHVVHGHTEVQGLLPNGQQVNLNTSLGVYGLDNNPSLKSEVLYKVFFSQEQLVAAVALQPHSVGLASTSAAVAAPSPPPPPTPAQNTSSTAATPLGPAVTTSAHSLGTSLVPNKAAVTAVAATVPRSSAVQTLSSTAATPLGSAVNTSTAALASSPKEKSGAKGRLSTSTASSTIVPKTTNTVVPKLAMTQPSSAQNLMPYLISSDEEDEPVKHRGRHRGRHRSKMVILSDDEESPRLAATQTPSVEEKESVVHESKRRRGGSIASSVFSDSPDMFEDLSKTLQNLLTSTSQASVALDPNKAAQSFTQTPSVEEDEPVKHRGRHRGRHRSKMVILSDDEESPRLAATQTPSVEEKESVVHESKRRKAGVVFSDDDEEVQLQPAASSTRRKN